MASHSKPLPSPAEPPAPTTIRDLSDDLLREILLRLPSLPSLVRAALTCRAFLAVVRSSPAFRCRFRELHPPPLLGFFFDPDGEENPTFTPIRRGSDRDHAAAVRGLDVFLTRVPHHDDDVFPGWQIMECRGGRLLLSNWRTQQLAVYNPLTGALDLVPKLPDLISKGHRGKFISISGDLFLVVPDDEAADRRSFRVVCYCYDKSRVRVAVFSSVTRKWQILPWSEPVPTQPASGKYWLLCGKQVNGFLCWAHHKNPYMVLLDTATLQFSFIDLPDGLSGQSTSTGLGIPRMASSALWLQLISHSMFGFGHQMLMVLTSGCLKMCCSWKKRFLRPLRAHWMNMNSLKCLQFGMALCT